MAITGKGTETEPWLVHSYDEIKTCFDKNKPEGADAQSSTYIKLSNDIDCNDYGDGWKWETINNGDISNGRTTFFDLNGHTIKNVMIKSGNVMFEGGGHIAAHNVKVMNGKLLNIFSEGATNIFKKSTLYKLSISVDASTITEQAFWCCQIDTCSIYVLSTKILGDGLFYFRRSKNYYAVNSDIWLDIKDMNQKLLWAVDSGDNDRCPATDCRFRGEINGRLTYKTYNSTIYSTLFGEKAERCVIDIACKSPISDIGNLSVFSDNEYLPTTSIFNESKFKGSYAYSIGGRNSIVCTDKEMKSYDELIKKGFSVVKVGD